MSRILLGALIACCAVPLVASAQIGRRHRHGCCDRCEQPTVQCQCQTTRPVVQTELRPQQVTTYRDVVETQMQQQQYVEQVPVTTYKQVTVDEGGYQMVYVPKPVTKQVPQTVMTQQVKTRAVPVQTMKRVPEVTTQLVPVQTVTHVPQTVTVAVPPPMVTVSRTITAPACDPCGNPLFGMANGMPVFAPPQMGYLPPTITSLPTITTVSPQFATLPAIPVPMPQPQLSAQPPLMSADRNASEWTTIAPRNSAAPAPKRNSYGDFDPAHNQRSAPIPTDDAEAVAPNPRTSGLFVPAPSAATAWYSRGNIMR